MVYLSSSFALRTHEQHEKAKTYDPPDQKESNILLGKSRGQLLIAPERMKQLGQSRNDVQMWMCWVVKVKSNTVKSNKNKNVEC